MARSVSLRKRSAAFVALSVACISLAGCLGYDGEIQHGYQFDQTAMADVKSGQTAEQVLVTLGSPSTTSTVGGDAWYYIAQKTTRPVAFMSPKVVDRRIYAVYFDKGKKVTRIANYGLQDGKVINFAGGATPTVGADGTFLKGMFLNFNPLGGLMQRS
jgi:outer membrane protein assembly factor BamE (lipoprotein component of BamABCDE complex)